MHKDDFDEVLASEDPIVPTSGFTAAVMEAVRRDAAATAPISFPWNAALPGLCAALAIAVCMVLAFVHLVRTSAPVANSASVLFGEALRSSVHFGLGWIALSLLLSLIAIASSMRLAGARV